MNLLLISNSTNPGEKYLDYPKKDIQNFLKRFNVKKVLFFPFAGVSFSYNQYVEKVQERFDEFNLKVEGVHTFDNPIEAIEKAEAIVVGGGNTFHLLKCMQEMGLVDAICKKVKSGTPYVGWSAGSNLACPTICTTNDMPIVEPQSFKALNLIPFQINPHYLDTHPQGHGGETREQRIEEYLVANPKMYVVGLRERSIFLVDGKKLSLIGPNKLRVFKQGELVKELTVADDLSFLL